MLREYESLQTVLLGTEKLVADHIMHHTCTLLFANTAVHRDGSSLPDLQRGTNRTEKPRGHCAKSYSTEAQSSSCQRRLLIFALQQSEICITRKALGKSKSQWFQKPCFHGAPYSVFKASCLRVFHGCSSAQRRVLEKDFCLNCCLC